MELNLGSTSKIKVIWNGIEYYARKPKTQELIDLDSKTELMKEKGSKSTDIMIEFLTSLGLPRDMILDLDVDALSLLVEGLMPSKKK